MISAAMSASTATIADVVSDIVPARRGDAAARAGGAAGLARMRASLASDRSERMVWISHG